ncbi:MAG: hypothetical protein JWN76_1848 [Chitinophagaceae bacterium]|nr:hypothetical protein [Chitinophagaceae bacterium]
MDQEEMPVAKYTVQLYYHPLKKDGQIRIEIPHPVQMASGVLIKNGQNHFLLTCKHVFDNISPQDIIILTEEGFAVRLPRDVHFIDKNSNSIDLTLIRLSGARVMELKSRYSFLPGKCLGFNHKFDEELWYMLYGFINKKTTRKSKEFQVESFGYLTNTRKYKKIEKIGFCYDNNITLEYNRRKQGYFENDRSSFGFKELKGWSGGGIWCSVEGKKKNTYNYFLVGIMIEERIERGFVVGNKIDLIENALRSHYRCGQNIQLLLKELHSLNR